MTRRVEFSVAVAAMTNGFKYKLVAYPSGRVSFPVESTVYWNTKEEAEAACARVNAGDETGVTFASYADD